MRKKQYLHKKTGKRFTLGMVVPTKQELLEGMVSKELIHVQAGMSILNPKDRYVKKTGRDLCDQRMGITPCQLQVFRIVQKTDFQVYVEALLNGSVLLYFVVCPKSDTPFLVDGEIL